jgi:Abortive infection C-terminus
MKISDFSIQEISKFIIGDSNKWPHRTRRDLIDFFNKLGLREMDYQNSDSKAVFAKNKVTELNGKPELKNAIKELLDPRRWTNITSSTVEECVVQINGILKYDNYEVIKDGNFYKVRELVGSIIELENHFAKSDKLSELLIEEQIKKCKEKIESADYSGAITNARSLVEAVCVKIEADLDPNALGNKGDLINLFNRVKVLLNLDPSRKDISNSLKQVLSGFSSIIQGLAAMRNSMSDAHAMPYKPNRHHAKLAVNSAKTLADFLFDSMNYQIERGSLKKKVS